MSRYNNRTIFSRIVEVINGSSVKNIIKSYNSDYRVQHFDTMSHINAMAYIQLSGGIGLREGIEKIDNSPKLKRLINVPSVSQISRKNATRDYRIFEDLFYMVLDKAKKKVEIKEYSKLFSEIKIIDSTLIQVASSLAPELEYANKKAGIRISTLMNLNKEMPEKVVIKGAKTGERKCIDGFVEELQALYLFDRGYYNYRWYDELTGKGVKFITRQLSYTKVERIEEINDSNIKDCKVMIGSRRRKDEKIYREISFDNEQGEKIVLLTNIFAVLAEQIIELYRLRWKIELFFKWIKQHLRIKEWLGHNENAMKIQIYVGLIVYILLALIEHDLKVKMKTLRMFRIIQVNLLEEYEINEILSG